MNVLIIEDDEAVAQRLRRALERASYNPVMVDNGVAAFAELGQRDFAAIICDIRLPFLNGEKFYGEVKAEYPDLANRFIFVSAWMDDKLQEFIQKTDCSYLAKPFELPDLLTTVKSVTGSAGPS